jgi:hypothetical protein
MNISDTMKKSKSHQNESLEELLKKAEEFIISIYGLDSFNELQYYTFEYSCREASFLQLRCLCESEKEYYDLLTNLCKIRRTEAMLDLQLTTERLIKRYKHSTLQVYFDFRSIEGRIHRGYYESSSKNIRKRY